MVINLYYLHLILYWLIYILFLFIMIWNLIFVVSSWKKKNK